MAEDLLITDGYQGREKVRSPESSPYSIKVGVGSGKVGSGYV